MPQTAIVTNEYEILLIGRKEVGVWLPIFPLGSAHKVPDGHKESIVGTKVCMVSKMEFGCVKEVSDGRPLADPEWVSDSNIHVSKGVDNVE